MQRIHTIQAFYNELSRCWDGRPFRGAGSPSNTLSPRHLRTKWHLDPSSCLATIDMGRKVVRLLCPFFRRERRAESSFNTIWPGPRPSSVPSGIMIHPTVWLQQIWGENGGSVPLGELGPHLTQCGLGQGLPRYQVTSWSIQPFSHKRHGLKLEGGCAAFLVEAGSPSGTMWPGPRPNLHTKWHLDASIRLATVEMGGKLGASAPFLGRGSWVPI